MESLPKGEGEFSPECSKSVRTGLGGRRDEGCSEAFHRLVPWPFCLAFVLLTSECLTGTVFGATIVIGSSADTGLMERFPDNNLGGEKYFNAGQIQNTGCSPPFLYCRNRGLLKFDLAGAVPPQSRITGVVLAVDITKVPGDNPDNATFYDVHRMLQSWGEGSKTNAVSPPSQGNGLGTPASLGEANWYYRFASNRTWTTPGGKAGSDYATNVSASQFISTPSQAPFYFDSTTQIVSDVQFWLDHPQSNFGWMIKAHDETEGWTARRFMAREDPINIYPALFLDYIPPPQINGVVLNGNQFAFSFTAEAGQPYLVQFRDDVSTATWQVLTNIPAPPDLTTVVVTDTLSEPVTNRFYRVVAP